MQVEIVGQLSGQMAEMVGGVVETVGEEPEPESEDLPEPHEEEEEELTKVSWKKKKTTLKSYFIGPKILKIRVNVISWMISRKAKGIVHPKFQYFTSYHQALVTFSNLHNHGGVIQRIPPNVNAEEGYRSQAIKGKVSSKYLEDAAVQSDSKCRC